MHLQEDCIIGFSYRCELKLDARAKYPDCSLADLYDELTMPPELRKANQENDKAVLCKHPNTDSAQNVDSLENSAYNQLRPLPVGRDRSLILSV